MTDLLFSPFRLGRLELPNRIVMSPMTRSRAVGNVPGDLVAEYYAQRASAGLIVTEGTSPSPNGLGYARIPGIYSSEQVDGWRKVTKAVHDAGGRVFLQIMHTGRVGHAANLPAGGRVLAPSPVALAGEMYTDASGPQPHPIPEAMTEADIEHAIEEHGIAAENAVAAGFDGIELHGANGYLIEQFLNTATNQRADGWGGPVAARIRFAVAVAERAAARIGADRVGIRLSPYGVFGGMVTDPETDDVYRTLVKELSDRKLVYVHLVDHSSMGTPPPPPALFAELRATFSGAVILSGGYDRQRAEHDLAEKKGDLVAFGRPFLSNPNLPDKLRRGAPLRAPDEATFYTPGPKGYTDWVAD